VLRIHVVQAFRDRISILPFQKFRDRFRVQLTSRNAKAAGSCFGQAEKIVGHGDGSLHGSQYNPSYTRALLRPASSSARLRG
jgi:hypothetical protein